MRFYDDMLDKYGFNDGANIPNGIERVRTVYIRVINTFARKRKSYYRAFAFDRSGMHNWCLIGYAHTQDMMKHKVSEKVLTQPGKCGMLTLLPYSEVDSKFKKAIDESCEMDLDSCWLQPPIKLVAGELLDRIRLIGEEYPGYSMARVFANVGCNAQTALSRKRRARKE